jgi:hypothetical protein
MASTIIVLVIGLGLSLLAFVALLVAVTLLARRNGQKVAKLSWSPTHGITAEFCEDSERNN